jgi:protein-disulfide isomerase
MSRSQTRQRMQERRATQSRRRTQIIIAVVVVAVAAVAILVLLSRPGTDSVASVASDYGDLTQEVLRDEQGIGLAIGDPNAPVTLTEYSDFSCPHCAHLSETIDKLIDDYVREGDLRIVYKPVAFVYPPYSTLAAQAAICAADQGHGWEMADQIWAMYNDTGPGAYTQQQFVTAAGNIGLDTSAFRTCFNSSATNQAVQDVIAEAQTLGITGTPTVYLNGEPLVYRGAEEAYGDFTAAIDQALGR